MMTLLSLSSIIKGSAALAICLAAAACTSAGDEPGASLEQTIAVPQVPADASRPLALAPTHISHQRPIASLPEAAGRVHSVQSRDYVDGLRQDVFYDGSALKGVRNAMTVLARTSRQPTLDEAVPLSKPTEPEIRSEIGGAFPHLPMQVVERQSSNAYGPYGLALGRVGGDVRCMYMWQWIDENRMPRDAGVEGPLSVRVRLCQAGTTFDAMAAMVDHLTIGVAADAPQEIADGDSKVISAPVEADASADQSTPSHKLHRKVTHKHIAHRNRDTDVARREPMQSDGETAHYVALPSEPILPQSSAAPTTTAALASDLPPEAYLGPTAAARAAGAN